MPRGKTRIYVVMKRDGSNERLVDATYDHMAIRHVVAQEWVARVASKDDLVRMLSNGTRVEKALEEPDA